MQIRLLPSQDEFIFSNTRFCAFFGGFGNGKTLAGCIKALRLSTEYPGNVGIIGRFSQPQLRATTRKTFFEMLGCNEDTITFHPMVSKFNKVESLLRFHNGSEILFRHLDSPSDLLSLNLGWFYVDQAEEISENIFLILQSRLRLERSPLRHGFLTGNPEGHNWIWRRFIHDGHPDYHMVQATSLENPYLPPDYVPVLLRSYPDVWVRRYVYGSWDVFEGQIYGEFDPRVHVIQPFAIPDAWPRYRSIDPGRTNPTCCLWFALDNDGNVFIYREYFQAGRIVSENARTIAEMSGTERYIYTVIDPSARQSSALGYGSVMAEYLDHGIETVPAANELRAGINRVCEYLRVDPERIHPETGQKGSPRLFIFSFCENLVREFPQYRWRQLKSVEMGAKNQPEEPLGVDDHALDALRYFLMSRPSLEEKRSEYSKTRQERIRWHPDELAAQRLGVIDDHMGGMI
jgi:PBSX family phage terminase large subunit